MELPITHSLQKMKEPQKLSIEQMFEQLNLQANQSSKFYYKDGLALAMDISQLFQPFMTSGQGPYLLDDYRIGIIRRGEMRSHVNLQECCFRAGMAVFVTPGSIVEPLEMSDDFQVLGMGIPADLFQIIHSGKAPALLNTKMKNGIHTLTGNEQQVLVHLFYNLWEIVHSKTENQEAIQEVIYHMIETITAYYNALFSQESPAPTLRNTSKEMFDRFLYLVNNHCREHRQLAFYAEKICVTERYLGTVIRQTSGQTAKEWIDKAVNTQAKVMLRHSNLQVAEIAERLNFPTSSFFCKYFKRLEGCTPQEYRLK